ncbi:MAG: PIG-L family deacetylase [Chloroflexi bacterium]|nr:PIG-L family deacetylase [Chloroflexota bacterium]
MRYVYLSPHLDDAVLSAGGLIYEQTRSGNPVEIWTIMCGFPPEGEVSPFAEDMHMQWGFSSARETVEKRRSENMNAAAIVGAKAVHFDFLDCIYRRSKNGDWLYAENIFDPPHADEADLPVEIAKETASRLQPNDVLVCQLAIGSHIDHVTVRKAAELLKRPLIYDADIPYLLNHPDELGPKTAGMKEKVYSISEAGLKSWQEAIAAYKSQMAVLFESPELMREKILAYWSEHQGIRFWEFE